MRQRGARADAACQRLCRRETLLAFERRKPRHGKRRENPENRNHDHELDQRKPAVACLFTERSFLHDGAAVARLDCTYRRGRRL